MAGRQIPLVSLSFWSLSYNNTVKWRPYTREKDFLPRAEFPLLLSNGSHPSFSTPSRFRRRFPNRSFSSDLGVKREWQSNREEVEGEKKKKKNGRYSKEKISPKGNQFKEYSAGRVLLSHCPLCSGPVVFALDVHTSEVPWLGVKWVANRRAKACVLQRRQSLQSTYINVWHVNIWIILKPYSFPAFLLPNSSRTCKWWTWGYIWLKRNCSVGLIWKNCQRSLLVGKLNSWQW